MRQGLIVATVTEEVGAMLGRAVPIRAATLAEAVAEAETIQTTEGIVVDQPVEVI